jgi:N-acetyl-anhydromuramyl-L-alanine amidase AmpD
MTLIVKSVPLVKGEYYDEIIKKDTIYIHHTAGSHRPDYTIAGWNSDKTKNGQQLKVATAYVIGGLSTTGNDAAWDGVVCKCFPEDKWAHHLGLSAPNNAQLNSKSIAIEICNYGWVTKSNDGKFYNYVNKHVPTEMVVELAKPFQGYKYYHRYTDKQIASLKELLLDLSKRFSIDIRAGLKPLLMHNKGAESFMDSQDAL